ncbi:MAG TPA: hypothetical protein VGQ89_09825, partial [Candidatus Limnocylindrales bacterium]|nr:hypothetical protein [Candidatus Limnocylindrales bacterium]
DVWTRAKAAVRSTTDAVTSSDVWTRSKAAVRTLGESPATADAWTRTGTYARALIDVLQSSDAWVVVGGALVTVGGLPPVARAAAFVQQAIARLPLPDGRASNDKPGGSASNPRPR